LPRPVSPLLHDYKPSAASQPKKSKAIQWFVVGLGIPLAGLAFVSTLTTTTPTAPPPEEPVITAADGSDFEQETAIELVYAETPLVLADAINPPPLQKLSLTIGRGDTLDKLFRKHDLDLGHLSEIAKLDEARKRFRKLKPGDQFEITHDEGEIVDRPIEKRKRLAYGTIQSSLFESAADAGLSDRVIMNIAGIFAWDVDFVLDIRSGDNYYVQYEEIWQDGEYVTDGEIVAAEFNNNGRTHQAIRFIDDEGRSDYYTPDGHSVRKAFLRAPVDFTRISSNFNPRRRHPILNTIRAHRGVDYAAPRGTPIKAAGDGKVIFRGVKGGYGNTIILQHGGNITTLYAHMSRFAGVRIGSRVRQGQTIGYVGSTGLATANHLHYEYRLNGVHRNPRTVELPQADPIDQRYRRQFLATVEPILQELEKFKNTQLASVAYSNK
jgi:murein DD-endopeptidase MepM/ murein hydrolase activator NlpD